MFFFPPVLRLFILHLTELSTHYMAESLSQTHDISPLTLSFLLCIVYFVKCIKTLIIPSDICRIVNGLLKTALGPPSGSTTTLSPVQDITFRHESVKCLVNIIKSMGTWMDKQRLGDSYLPNTNESDTSAEKTENHLTLNTEEGAALDNEIHPEGNSDAATLEQRRAFKIELQVELCFTCMGTHFLYCYILLIYRWNSYKCKSVRPFMLYDFHGSFSHHLIGIWAKSLSLPCLLFLWFCGPRLSRNKPGSPFSDNFINFNAERYLTVQ